jgi:HPt (histidine-containing phosphotransfer) domain-containing protein
MKTMKELHLDEALFEELRDILEDDFPLLVTAFIQDSALRVEDLQLALARGDAESVRTTSHSLKGAAANLGLTQLVELCRQLEEAGRMADLEDKQPLLQQIRQQQQWAAEVLPARL